MKMLKKKKRKMLRARMRIEGINDK